MFCKYCGTPIDTDRMICDGCGRAAAWEAGNGFWDLKNVPTQRDAESGATEWGNTRREDPAPDHARQEDAGSESVRQENTRRKSHSHIPAERATEAKTVQNTKLPLLLGGVILGLFLIGLLLSGVSHRRSLRELERYYTAQIEEQSIRHQAELDAVNLELEERSRDLDALNREVEELRLALEQQESHSPIEDQGTSEDPNGYYEDPYRVDQSQDEGMTNGAQEAFSGNQMSPFPYPADPVWPDSDVQYS